jgi:sortase (surface protein transpeptidase)
MELSKQPVSLDTIATVLSARAAAFLFVFFLVFSTTYVTMTAFSAVPDMTPVLVATEQGAIDTQNAEVTPEAAADIVPEDAREQDRTPLPHTLVIDALDRELPIQNPESRLVADLDAALLTGVVRHPDSATLATEGTMFILGHSSYLPKVNNRFFQAFNGIQTLEWGDTIRLYSDDTEYIYEVERVYEAKASELVVPIATAGQRLTLATCDSFGSADDRFIVEATLLTTNPR